MQTFRTTHRVPHSAGRMFALVADVERYPEFLPLCRSLVVRDRGTGEEGREVLVADMTVAYKFLRETLTSRVTLDPERHVILVEYLDGPFRWMENRWDFRPAGEETCDVDFYIAYEFRSRALQLMMGAMFDKAFRKFVTAFEERADRVYGAREAAARTG